LEISCTLEGSGFLYTHCLFIDLHLIKHKRIVFIISFIFLLLTLNLFFSHFRTLRQTLDL
jgi:hypothetical protein